ncbi:MAG: radical SAM protein [Endomicrobiales bacterium]
MRDLSAPFSVCLAVTGRCNLACRHCSASRLRNGRELGTREMLRLIRQMGKAKVFNIAIFGGEPLLREDLLLLVREIRKFPIRLSLNTNATLAGPGTARALVEAGVGRFVVSLDGKKQSHDAMRGAGAFDRTVTGIRNIKKAGGRALISFTLTKLNIEDIEAVAALGKRMDCPVRFNPVFYGGNALCSLDEVFVTREEEDAARDRVHRMAQKYPGRVIGAYVDQYRQMRERPEPAKDFVTVHPCDAGTRSCAIRPDGWMTPCELLWEVKTGSLRSRSFPDVWKHSKKMERFRKVMKIDLKKHRECSGCAYQHLCFQGHRCFPYYYPGGIDNKALYCLKWQKKFLKKKKSAS